MPRISLPLLVWVVCAFSSFNASAKDSSMKQAFLGIRILTANEGSEPLSWSVVPPPGCTVAIDDHTSGQNSKEFFFHVWVPDSKAGLGPFHVTVDPTKVRGVLASATDIELAGRYFVRQEARANGIARVDYQQVGDGITFSIPTELRGVSLPPDDLAEVSEHYTFIETPGIYIRIGHADEARRRGAYANGAWPVVEAKAALNLQFAAREAIKALRLDSAIQDHGGLTIMLMNFDTNYPTLGPGDAHDDWPPHWHMHLYWKASPRVRKVGHFYIAPDGLLFGNLSYDFKSLEDRVKVKRWVRRGEEDKTTTLEGRVLYGHTITPEGHFKLSSPDGACLFAPVAGGFDSGVDLTCNFRNQLTRLRIRADDDPSNGRIQFFLNDRLEEDFRYDRDTGALLP